MGLIYIEHIEHSVKGRCSKCLIDICTLHNDCMVNTSHGEYRLIFYDNVVNAICIEDPKKISQLNITNNVCMFDDNMCFDTPFTSKTIDVYCRNCNFHIGWKFAEQYILKVV